MPPGTMSSRGNKSSGNCLQNTKQSKEVTECLSAISKMYTENTIIPNTLICGQKKRKYNVVVWIKDDIMNRKIVA